MNNKTEFYIKWIEGDRKGLLYIGVIGTTVSIKNLSGCVIREDTLEHIILSWKPLRKALKRALEMAPNRKNRFGFDEKRGMSGCVSVFIKTQIKNSKYAKSKKIWHMSMEEKFNEDLDIYVRDLVDYIQYDWKENFSNTHVENDLRKASRNLDYTEIIEPIGFNSENSYSPLEQTNPFADSDPDEEGPAVTDYSDRRKNPRS